MLQKCNAISYLMAWIFAVIAGCASQTQSINKKSVDVAKVTPESPTENLSTKTVVPVGYEKFMGIFTPYRTTIQQGNFVSKEMAAQVKDGMTREQVRFVLGTALLTDMFHADRWDYVFRLLKPNGELTTSRVTVYFEKNLVSKIEHGDLPTEQEYLARITDLDASGQPQSN